MFFTCNNVQFVFYNPETFFILVRRSGSNKIGFTCLIAEKIHEKQTWEEFFKHKNTNLL